MRLYKDPKSRYWYADLRSIGRGRLSTGKTSKKEAEAVIYEKLAEIGHVPPKHEPISLSDLIQRYKAYSRSNKTLRSYERDCGTLRLFLSHCQDIKISEITPEMIEGFKLVRIRTVKPATINREINSIRGMLTKSVAWGYLDSSPMQYVARMRVPVGLPKFYTPTEIRRLLTKSPQPWRNIWKLFLYTGIRRGEALAMTWTDVRGDRIYISNPKEGKEKVIPVSPQLKRLLKAMRNKSERVVPYEMSYLTRTFKSCALDAGIGGNLHRLRHTVATFLLSQGEGINKVQKLLGHASLATTSLYTKALEEELKASVDLLKW